MPCRFARHSPRMTQHRGDRLKDHDVEQSHVRAPPVASALLLPAVVVDMTGTNKAVTALVHGAAVPLYQQLSDLLRERIRQGRYGPLDRLPSEHELVRDYAISRITARQALAELERAGVVFRVQGRGSFVAEPA